MKKYIVLLALCLCQFAYATGTSHTTLKITPLSVNEQGALLYRYKIITNSMGGHYLESVSYGVGSFKDGEFTSLQEQVIHGDLVEGDFDYEKYDANVKERDQWLSSPCKSDDLRDGFTSCNLENHVVNRSLNASEIQKEYGIDITRAVSYFLLPGKLHADEDTNIYVTHAFNGLIVAEFNYIEGCDSEEVHAPLSIAQGYYDEFKNFHDYGYAYECTNVTGLIMKE